MAEIKRTKKGVTVRLDGGVTCTRMRGIPMRWICSACGIDPLCDHIRAAEDALLAAEMAKPRTTPRFAPCCD